MKNSKQSKKTIKRVTKPRLDPDQVALTTTISMARLDISRLDTARDLLEVPTRSEAFRLILADYCKRHKIGI